MRLLAFEYLAQPRAVEHGQHMAAIGHLHGRRIRVAIAGDDLEAEALKFDNHFFAQLARSAEQGAGGGRGEGRSESRH